MNKAFHWGSIIKGKVNEGAEFICDNNLVGNGN